MMGLFKDRLTDKITMSALGTVDSKTVGKAVCDDPFFCLGVGYMVCMLGTVWW